MGLELPSLALLVIPPSAQIRVSFHCSHLHPHSDSSLHSHNNNHIFSKSREQLSETLRTKSSFKMKHFLIENNLQSCDSTCDESSLCYDTGATWQVTVYVLAF